MDRFKLKWRIFVFLLGFCAMLIAVLWLFQSVLLTDMYKLIRKGELERAVALVEENIDNPDLSGILSQLEHEKEIVVMPTQDFIPPTRPGQANLPPPVGRTRLPDSITQDKVFIRKNGHQLSLTFYAMISPVDATVSTLRIQLYFITGIMLLLAVVIAIIMAKRVSKPMEEVNQAAKSLARGSYDIHFGGKGFLEMKELSDTLNTAAAELSKVEALRRELMANVSHDLRTPLSLIYSYAEMMHDFPDEITPEQTRTIMDETRRLTTLVNDVLDLSQLEAGSQELNLFIYNLTENISASIERTAALVRQDGYTLIFEHDEEVYVKADENKIMQVLYNLLMNAVNYSGADKRVIVRQRLSPGAVTIQVIDSGEGINAKDLPYVWERYYKVDKPHKRAVAGTGLGLSIVKKVIDLHGGSCGVESESGKGSVFWFTLKAESL